MLPHSSAISKNMSEEKQKTISVSLIMTGCQRNQNILQGSLSLMYWAKRGRGRRTSQNSVLVRTVLKTSKMFVFGCPESGAGKMESRILSVACDGLYSPKHHLTFTVPETKEFK